MCAQRMDANSASMFKRLRFKAFTQWTALV
jgi:hypothetical protein